MCPVDRRWYRDGDFNGQWTSQLAPSQCSGILFPPPPAPPRCSFSLSLLSLSFSFSCTLHSFLYIIFLLASLPVSLPYFLPLSLRCLKSFIPISFSFSFCFCCQAKIPIYIHMRPGRLPDWSGILQTPLSSRTREHRKPGSPILSAKKFIARSTLIGREIIGHTFSPSARSKRLSLIHDFSRIIAGPCHRLSLPPPPPLSSVRRSVKHLLFLPSGFLATSRHHSDRI